MPAARMMAFRTGEHGPQYGCLSEMVLLILDIDYSTNLWYTLHGTAKVNRSTNPARLTVADGDERLDMNVEWQDGQTFVESLTARCDDDGLRLAPEQATAE
jgi:hypothetical protein